MTRRQPSSPDLFNEKAFATAVLGKIGRVQRSRLKYDRELIFQGPFLIIFPLPGTGSP